MSLSISIHPQSIGGRIFENGATMAFRTKGPFRPDNANSVELIFATPEYHDKDKRKATPRDPFLVEQAVCIFQLSETDAEILGAVGLLDDARRRELVKILRHMLDVQAAEEEDGDAA